MEIFLTWIDIDKARLYQFTQEKMERTVINNKTGQELAEEITAKLKSASRILILGPGVAKTDFQNYLNQNYPNLTKKVVGCEELLEPTDAAIAEWAQRFFNSETK